MNPNRIFARLTRLCLVLVMLAAFAPTAWAANPAPAAEHFLPGAWGRSGSNPVFNPAAGGGWDDQFAFAPAVLWNGASYQMWYAGSSVASATRKIGYATSANGTVWVRQGSAPVLNPGTAGAWDEKGVSFPSVLKEGSTYKMWYTGQDAAGVGRVGYATSPDGIVWTKSLNNPVLNVGSAGSWDAVYAGMASVIKVGSTYQLWYRGGSTSGGAIGYATSADGLNWAKVGIGISGGSGSWDDTPYHPEVLFDGTAYHMWYSGCNLAGDLCQVGYATSTNGAQWTRRGLVLPQGSAGTWDDGSTDHAAVLLVGGTLKMWYSGYHGLTYRIGLASAPATLLDRHIFLPAVRR